MRGRNSFPNAIGVSGPADLPGDFLCSAATRTFHLEFSSRFGRLFPFAAGTLRRYLRSAVNLARPTSIARALVAVAMVFSWLVLSNHCALGLMQTARVATDHAGCCGHDDGSGGAPAPVRECCQSLNALAPVHGVTVPPAACIALLPAMMISVMEWSEFVITPVRTISLLETGPPGARSFVELVLQRSLRSHAPPALA